MHDLLPDWTDMPDENREARVRKLVLDGKSASMIARHFRNCTRNSIIGYCTRNHIPMANRPGPKPSGEPSKPKAHGNLRQPKVQAIVAKKARMQEEPAFEAAPLPEEELGNDVTHLLGIMDLKADSCRWMFGDPKGEHGYCGKTTKPGSSWCPEHDAVVFKVQP
jgi:hypothetical protein